MGKQRSSDWADTITLDTQLRKLEAENKDMGERLGVYERLRMPKNHRIPVYKPENGQAMAVAMLSDVHLEERVDPSDVPGTYNIYTPEICAKRLDQFAQRVVLLTETNRSLTNIRELCLFLGGDIITGTLHEDQSESNNLQPMHAMYKAIELVTSVIRHLLKNGNFQRIIIPCTFGNHGRLTKKPRHKMAAGTNLEWLMYNFLASHVFRDEPRIVWHISEASMVYLNLYGFMCRFTHGDRVNFQGGVGGINVPIQRMVKNWNQVQHAAYTFMGHFHQLSDFGNVLVNGSVVGPSAYSLNNGFSAERPKQLFALIDRKRGKSLVADIWCDHRFDQPEEKTL